MNEENARKLLFDVADALDGAGLPFCLGAGTLLGAIREDRFIPIDRDIDLWARAEEFEPRVLAIQDEMRIRGIQIETIDHRHAGFWGERDYAVKFKKYGEHGDLTAFTKLGPYRYNPTHGSPEPFCIVFDADKFDDWASVEFYGKSFKIPYDGPHILYELYDHTWQIPDTEYGQSCLHRAYHPHFLTKHDIVYVGMCLDVLHPGHLNILAHAAELDAGQVWVGLLTDEAIKKYKGPPVLDFSSRHRLALGLKFVDMVVPQEDYLQGMLQHKPAYLVHGDDWKEGPQIASRRLVLDVLPHWGGRLIEVPYTEGYSSTELKNKIRDTKS